LKKIAKNRDFEFLTGSEQFLADFEKNTIFRFFENFPKITKIVKNHSKVTFLTRMAIENVIFGSKPARMIPSKSIFDLRGPIFCKIHDFLAKSCFFLFFLSRPAPHMVNFLPHVSFVKRPQGFIGRSQIIIFSIFLYHFVAARSAKRAPRVHPITGVALGKKLNNVLSSPVRFAARGIVTGQL